MPGIEFDGVTSAGDLFGMFNDTPAAQSLISYLVTAEAQQIWVERGGALSANKERPAGRRTRTSRGGCRPRP